MDRQIWSCCRSRDAFTCHESRAEGFPTTRQFHRSRSDDLLYRDTAAALVAGDAFIPNGDLPVRCYLHHSARRDSHNRASLGAWQPRDNGVDHITFCFVKEYVVPEAKTGLPTNLTLAGRGRSMHIQADVHGIRDFFYPILVPRTINRSESSRIAQVDNWPCSEALE